MLEFSYLVRQHSCFIQEALGHTESHLYSGPLYDTNLYRAFLPYNGFYLLTNNLKCLHYYYINTLMACSPVHSSRQP